MDYMTAREAAEQWGLAERTVQQLCRAGWISGARKFGGAWAVPAGTEKPGDPRRKDGCNPGEAAAQDASFALSGLLPLMNTPFPSGGCRAAIEGMEAGPRREMAWAEYHYFSGRAEEAAEETVPYLSSPDLGLRLSAALLHGYASLTTGEIARARQALEVLNTALTEAGEQLPQLRAAVAFAGAAAAVLLHLPLPEGLPAAEDLLPLLPPGLRSFALYVQAHYRYLQGEYGKSAGMVEAALAMGAAHYPIPAIYLHLVAVMDYMSLKQTDQARTHLLSAWALAQPDGLIEGFGEHHGLLGGMLEAELKPCWPEQFRRIIDITYRFSWGWRQIHNSATGHDVADNLTTTEFAAAMLAAREWTNQEIAAHMKISPNTVKRHLSQAMKKLGVEQRQELKQYMLR